MGFIGRWARGCGTDAEAQQCLMTVRISEIQPRVSQGCLETGGTMLEDIEGAMMIDVTLGFIRVHWDGLGVVEMMLKLNSASGQSELFSVA